MSNLVDGPLSGRQTNSQRRPITQVDESFESDGQMRAAFVASQRVDLVDDDGLDLPQSLASLLGGDDQVQRLGGGHQNMRRLPQHFLPFGGWRVARSHRRSNRRPS